MLDQTLLNGWKDNANVKPFLDLMCCKPWEPGQHDNCPKCKAALPALENLLKMLEDARVLRMEKLRRSHDILDRHCIG